MEQPWMSLSKANWKKLVEKELKGKAYEELIVNINDQISIEPYYTLDEVNNRRSALLTDTQWEIAEDFYYIIGNEAKLNQTLLEALNGGVQSATFYFDEIPDEQAISVIFDKVLLKYISVYFKFSSSQKASKLLSFFEVLVQINHIVANELTGGILSEVEMDVETSDKYPNISWNCLASDPMISAKDIDIAYAQMLSDAAKKLENFTNKEQLNYFAKTFAILEISTNYLFEIAKLRAWQLLWGNLQKAYNVQDILPSKVDICFSKDAYTQESSNNMIAASSMSISAILGGASRITVRPASNENESFHKRISRNVLHLADLESGFRQVADPAAGSYYLETLTDKIADSAWNIFIKKQEPGATNF